MGAAGPGPGGGAGPAEPGPIPGARSHRTGPGIDPVPPDQDRFGGRTSPRPRRAGARITARGTPPFRKAHAGRPGPASEHPHGPAEPEPGQTHEPRRTSARITGPRPTSAHREPLLKETHAERPGPGSDHAHGPAGPGAASPGRGPPRHTVSHSSGRHTRNAPDRCRTPFFGEPRAGRASPDPDQAHQPRRSPSRAAVQARVRHVPGPARRGEGPGGAEGDRWRPASGGGTRPVRQWGCGWGCGAVALMVLRVTISAMR
ncbi:hypothetical protein SAMN02745830_06087 [Streptomyces sp. Amel2xC10]|nr:hypothetical protein SAMN02745830_06087 [Streptomyces sp. Amel2xC10]